MSSYKIIPINSLRTISKPQNMACYAACSRPARRYHGLSPFFSRSSPFGEFASSVQPLFRLLDEELTQAGVSRPLRSFQPRFDVREEKEAFHLHGELPGIDQQDINIEFKDENTLVISGRTVRESKKSSDEDVKGNGKAAEAVEAAPETAAADEPSADSSSETGSNYHKPTVEDEFVDVASESQPAATPATSATEVAKTAEETAPAKSGNEPRYWVSERSVGQFHRSFTFPGHVDQEAVTASLKNGILNVVVPKAAQKEPRRIAIQ